MSGQSLSTPIRKVAVILLVAVGGIFLVSWYLHPRPSENNRVQAPGGYSVIRPDGWSADIVHPGRPASVGNAPVRDFIELMPHRFVGVPPKLYVNRLVHAPDLNALRGDGWTDGTFAGRTVLMLERKGTQNFERRAVFERSGQWFEVGEGLPRAGRLQADDWWKFLETFRYPEPGTPPPPPAQPSTAPATNRSTEPSTEPSMEPSRLPVVE